MDTDIAVEALSALAHPGRLDIFRLLVRRAPDAVRAGDIARALGVRATTLSNQLAQLEAARLVRSRRDGRSIRYTADTERAGALIAFLAADCCRNRPEACLPATATLLRRAEPRMRNVLFLCTANSARSLICEALLNHLGEGRFRAFSAGSAPRPAPHPLALEILRAEGIDVSTLSSKSWAAFREPGAPEFDFVFTVCDLAANEPCPAWAGQPMSAHWGAPDPAAVTGSDAKRRAAFRAVFDGLKARISALVAAPLEDLDARTLQRRLDAIADIAPRVLEPG